MKTIKLFSYSFCTVALTLLFFSCQDEAVSLEPSLEPTASLHEALVAESEALLKSMQEGTSERNARTASIEPISFDLMITLDRGRLAGRTTSLPVVFTTVNAVSSNKFIYQGTISAENGVEVPVDAAYRPSNSNSLSISFYFDGIFPDGSEGNEPVLFGQSVDFLLANGFLLSPSASGPFETISFDRGLLFLNSSDDNLSTSASIKLVPSAGAEEAFVPFVTADSTIEYALEANLMGGPSIDGVFTLTSARDISDADNTVQVQGTITYADGKRGEIRYNIIPRTGEITASQITRFTQTDAGAVDVEFYILGDNFRLVRPTVGFGDLLAGDAFDEETFGDRVGSIFLRLISPVN
jgi:hypothetical protein